MIRRARQLIASAFERIAAALAPDDVVEFDTLSDQLFDAAELALGNDYEPPPVVVDTREQRPFAPFLWQRGERVYLAPERMCLEEGDYTTPSLLPYVRIERKSIPDLYGSLFGTGVSDSTGEALPNQERLRREFLRLGAYPRVYFVIEGMPRDLVDYIISRKRRVDPAGAVQLVESMGFDYGINVQWRRDREAAEWFVGYILARGHAQATEKAEAKKSRKRGLALPWVKADDDETKMPAFLQDFGKKNTL